MYLVYLRIYLGWNTLYLRIYLCGVYVPCIFEDIPGVEYLVFEDLPMWSLCTLYIWGYTWGGIPCIWGFTYVEFMYLVYLRIYLGWNTLYLRIYLCGVYVPCIFEDIPGVEYLVFEDLPMWSLCTLYIWGYTWGGIPCIWGFTYVEFMYLVYLRIYLGWNTLYLRIYLCGVYVPCIFEDIPGVEYLVFEDLPMWSLCTLYIWGYTWGGIPCIWGFTYVEFMYLVYLRIYLGWNTLYLRIYLCGVYVPCIFEDIPGVEYLVFEDLPMWSLCTLYIWGYTWGGIPCIWGFTYVEFMYLVYLRIYLGWNTLYLRIYLCGVYVPCIFEDIPGVEYLVFEDLPMWSLCTLYIWGYTWGGIPCIWGFTYVEFMYLVYLRIYLGWNTLYLRIYLCGVYVPCIFEDIPGVEYLVFEDLPMWSLCTLYIWGYTWGGIPCIWGFTYVEFMYLVYLRIYLGWNTLYLRIYLCGVYVPCIFEDIPGVEYLVFEDLPMWSLCTLYIWGYTWGGIPCIWGFTYVEFMYLVYLRIYLGWNTLYLRIYLGWSL